ncbi:MAG: DUF1800 domain-containing protein [Actinobacteria bacterium]|nr:DUF1800 domain-containing protein [Actinomycetota bacterium]
MTPRLVTEAGAAGGPQAWFEGQLKPLRIADTSAATMRGWFSTLSQSPQSLWGKVQADQLEVSTVGLDLARWTILQRTYSRRQLREVMAAFWSDFLHIPINDAGSWPHRIRYDSMIRAHALGRFDQLLTASVLHPAMGGYLDNARSTRLKLNENLGREVLELYTVGLDSGYTEAMVVDSARLLTGYRVDLFNTWRARYVPTDHATGAVRVLGFSSANSAADGRSETVRYLRYLAHHPATADRLARRLCVRFVSDDPPQAIVRAVARAYTNSATSIPAALRAMVQHPEFGSAVSSKVRTPLEDVIATYRVLDVRAQRPRTPSDFANAVVFMTNCMGQRPFEWPRPDGPPDAAEAYTSASRMLASWTTHQSLAGGFTPTSGVVYREPYSWLPPLPATVGEIIDDVGRRVLARPSNTLIRRAAAARMGLPLRTRVRTPADIAERRISALLACLLDTPQHMTR